MEGELGGYRELHDYGVNQDGNETDLDRVWAGETQNQIQTRFF